MGSAVSVGLKSGVASTTTVDLVEMLASLPVADRGKLASALATAGTGVLPPKKEAKSPCVAIIYYSTYGHLQKLAEEIKKGVEAAGVSADLFQVPETLSPEVLGAMHAPEKPKDIMTIDHSFLDTFKEYDGFIFGAPSRFGLLASQMKAFFDGTSSLWMSGGLVGKLAASFCSTGTPGGGQETVHLSLVTQFVHHGMAYVPLGYASAGAEGQFDTSCVHGGSPWGSSTMAGADGASMPVSIDLAIAKKQGEMFGATLKKRLAPPPERKPKICIVYYSMMGHLKKMADEIKSAMKKAGAEVDIYQAAELVPQEVLDKMKAPPKADDPVMDYTKVEKLTEYDGFCFGVPTRFGGVAAQMKNFFDSTGDLWTKGSLAGKPACTFVSTGTLQGGQETTHLTTLTNLVHHGMVYVPLGYAAGQLGQFDMKEVHGGSPWGSGTIAGAAGERQPSEMELKIANKQGEHFVTMVKQMIA